MPMNMNSVLVIGLGGISIKMVMIDMLGLMFMMEV